VMPTAAMQLDRRINHRIYKHCILLVIYAFNAFMVVGRLISGVHWLSDIIGGALLSAGLVMLYRHFTENTN
ncbi:MAG: phosphatase PAP2 family protein, partial [Oscillospiraceae bacterium]|nr:phosphatase PAP2 family protein [Oscillospiraceae bacterium]